MLKLILAVILTLGFSSNSQAVNIAIIDSGTDFKHIDLQEKTWVNVDDEIDGSDNDSNGKIDDRYGWNFAEDNNKVIDYSYLGTFSQDPYKYFEIQLKQFKGTINDDERAWIQQKRQDMNFIKEMQKFGNFVHGTHVAGISARNSQEAKIIGLKIIPTEVKLPGDEEEKIMSVMQQEPVKGAGDGEISPVVDLLLKKGLDALAANQGKTLDQVGLYAWDKKAKVANGSFGTSSDAVKPLIAQILTSILKREPTEEEVLVYTKYFINSIVTNGRQFTVTANDTFFVFAAGNDGKNNDELPVFPANVKRKNTIAVAATFGVSKLASFSNYGTEMVEVAAPGVGILSSIPGNEHLRVSGTSQAAPFVTNVVGRMMDVNPNMTFIQIKKILMDTVDFKEFLKDKVTSGGIVNADRAVLAAELLLTKSITDAVYFARQQIGDVKEKDVAPLDEFGNEIDDRALLIDMPQLFR